jgi:hypothetical protein
MGLGLDRVGSGRPDRARPSDFLDVSGNVSKQYNAHTNVYVANLNLPHQRLSQEYFVRFCSTSPHASSSEQFITLGLTLNRRRAHHAPSWIHPLAEIGDAHHAFSLSIIFPFGCACPQRHEHDGAEISFFLI